MGRKSAKMLQNKSLCSYHFLESDFTTVGGILHTVAVGKNNVFVYLE